MPRIKVKFDDNLPKKELAIALTNTSIDESGEDFMDTMRNDPEIMQTSIYGIATPLIAINDITVDFSDVKFFSLKNDGPVPSLYIEVYDRGEILTMINTPRLDNFVAIQILPPFDNAYKKINLIFYISNINIDKNNRIIKISGNYKVPDLISKQFKCFGELSTYEFLETIAKETKLGFATNWENEQDDKRYIYCNNISYLELLNNEIKRSLSDNTRIFDYWIDYWNYINFVNIYERYTTIENLDDKQNWIWVSSQPNEMTEGNKIVPEQIPLKLTNHPSMQSSDLYVVKYNIISKPGLNYSQGSDKVYSIYEENKQEYQDHYYQSEDVLEDIFLGLEYMGEVYGNYNYMLAEANRKMYLKKMGIETIKIILNRPLLSITRGSKVDFIWYNISPMFESRYNKYVEAGIVNDKNNIQTNIPLNDEIPSDYKDSYNQANGEFIIDKSISGQYLVLSNNISYENGNWNYVLTLSRPFKDKPDILTKKIE